MIEFIHANPLTVIPHVKARIKQWGSKKIMIMEDSNNVLKNVLGNIMSYAHLVTKDAFIVVQNTKLSRPDPPIQPRDMRDTITPRFIPSLLLAITPNYMHSMPPNTTFMIDVLSKPNIQQT